MSLHMWLAFLAATVALLTLPGPTTLLVVSYSLKANRRATLWIALGVVLGDFAAMGLSLLGMGLLLSTSALLFSVVKWIGAGYLVYLGVKMWRTDPPDPTIVQLDDVRTYRGMMAHAFSVTLLNPQSIVFFVAFLPQFVLPGVPLLSQMLILGSTFLLLSFLNAASFALLAGFAARTFVRPTWRRTMNRLGGGMLVGAAVLTAAIRYAR